MTENSQITIPVGTSSFREVRTTGAYYIDKTGLIRELLCSSPAKATLITRPRRFGKTMAMSMLSEFFDIRRDSRKLFEGLAISQDVSLCEQWMNQYPTVFLSLKSVDGLNFDTAAARLASAIADQFQSHLYLLDSDRISIYCKNRMDRLCSLSASHTELGESLKLLIKMLSAYYGKPVILLIDEYDVPLAKAGEHDYYEEMLDLIRSLMQALKDDESLCFAVVTGCLRIAKESIFTGLNNFVTESILNPGFDEYLGFTEAEVRGLLADTGLSDHAQEIQEWYDGYNFGNARVYCPWDVMNYVRDLLRGRTSGPIEYWNNSSDNAILRSFVDELSACVSEPLETLLAGGTIVRRVREDTTYHDLQTEKNPDDREAEFWSILYLTGYVTTDMTAVPSASPECPASSASTNSRGELPLRIPNREVRIIFEDTIAAWLRSAAKTWDRNILMKAVWNADTDTLSAELSRMLLQTISYHDYGEDFYHAFLAGVFTGTGYLVKSNREHGEGRSDILLCDAAGRQAALFEAKRAGSQREWESGCRQALQQIRDRRYSEDLTIMYPKLLVYGIVFYRKRCRVERLR